MNEHEFDPEPKAEKDALVTDNVFKDICKRLKITSVDVDKVQRAKDLLSSLQRHRAFMNLLGTDDDESVVGNPEDLLRLASTHSLRVMSMFVPGRMSSEDDMAENEEMSEDMCQMPFEEERWGNYFTDFQMLNLSEGIDGYENRKCIQLGTMRCDQDLHQHLQSGVRCFMLNLFCGPMRENQDLIVQIREAEIAVSKEFGFPVASTIIAKLSPRQQYTGFMEADTPLDIAKGSRVVLTVDRNFSRRCSASCIYVNARFLLGDVRKFDIIPIGEEIQLMVRAVRQGSLICCVCRGGVLSSFMPVLFPARCAKNRISYEEVEDLTFAREVGIHIVVSHLAGSVKYVDNLEMVMDSLHCDSLRVYARVVLNEIQGCDRELNWIVDRYDGFVIELADPLIKPNIMHLCPNAECFMQRAYKAKKPIIFDGWQINEQHLRVNPDHYYYAFYYPDKYLIRCNQARCCFYLSFLQSAIFEQLVPCALSKMPHCDKSHTGSDGLARAIVIASIEVNAKAIIVIGVTTRMVQKISHFRPLAPIIFVSHMRSAEDYVSVYHNVTMLSFRTTDFSCHERNIFRKAVFAFAYLAARKIIKQDDQVIIVYNYAIGTTYPEKYLIFKFEKLHFVQHLARSLFSDSMPFPALPVAKK